MNDSDISLFRDDERCSHAPPAVAARVSRAARGEHPRRDAAGVAMRRDRACGSRAVRPGILMPFSLNTRQISRLMCPSARC